MGAQVFALKCRQNFWYQRQRDDLPAYAQESEAERWTELVFCVLCQCAPNVEPESVRTLVSTLRNIASSNPPTWRLAARPRRSDSCDSDTQRFLNRRGGHRPQPADTYRNRSSKGVRRQDPGATCDRRGRRCWTRSSRHFQPALAQDPGGAERDGPELPGFGSRAALPSPHCRPKPSDGSATRSGICPGSDCR